ncbi:MAG: hypothetical protein JWM73_2540 [Solirubrobacterales bacterium]|nr:hypothetical protein [Solirubrobacterales bacterium]
MLVMRPERIAPLIAASRRRPTPSPEQRVVYELARLRVADTREPPRRFGHLARAHD